MGDEMRAGHGHIGHGSHHSPTVKKTQRIGTVIRCSKEQRTISHDRAKTPSVPDKKKTKKKQTNKKQKMPDANIVPYKQTRNKKPNNLVVYVDYHKPSTRAVTISHSCLRQILSANDSNDFFIIESFSTH